VTEAEQVAGQRVPNIERANTYGKQSRAEFWRSLIVFGCSVVHSANGQKYERALDSVLVRIARAAHSTSLVLNETTLLAVGDTSSVQDRRSP
jgi:hypothetical protein